MPIAVSRKGGDALYVASGAPLPPFRYEEFGVPDMTVSCSYIPVAGAASPGACSGRCAIFQLLRAVRRLQIRHGGTLI
jgi:hypothetical protein